MPKTIEEIAQQVQGTVVGNGQGVIQGITNMETPGPDLITFAQDQKALRKLEASPVGCILVPPKFSSEKKTLIQVPEPKIAWARLLREFYPPVSFPKTISGQAAIAASAKIGKDVTVEPFAVIGENTVIEDGAVLRSFSYVGRDVTVGRNTILHPSVMIYERCMLGKNVVIHAGTVIGCDGFGYVHTSQAQEKVPQVGNVVIEDDVEVGACVTIDRATVGSTVIGRGCKIDNLVQVAHNVTIGPHTVLSSQTGISGSSKIGTHVTMGGKVGLGDHVEIGDWTMVGAGAGLPSGKRVPPKQIIFGEPARPYQQARKQIAAQLRSAEMLEELRDLRKRVAELEKKTGKS